MTSYGITDDRTKLTPIYHTIFVLFNAKRKWLHIGVWSAIC